MAIAKVKKYLKSMIITTAISITLLSGCTSSIPTPPSTTNNYPTISAPDSLSFDEGISHSFNVDVSDEDSIDELTFSGESNEYSAGFNKVDENTMEVVLTPKDNYRNFNGVSNLNLTVQDSQGAATQKDITLNVNDTPDVEFYNMPDSVSLEKGEKREVTGYIRDDYTSLEDLVLNASCENADVNIEKIGGDEFKIIIDANTDYLGDSNVVVNAADDEGNNSSYNLPITITMLENNPPTISAPNSLSFDEGISHSFSIDVSDEDDIDELTFSGESTEYSAGFNKVDENTMEVVLTPKENYRNFNGVSNLNLTVQDSQGATAQKDITLNVNDTPDVEFYNMPESVSVEKGETKEITGYIRDDYTSLEDLVLNASCENADVNIEKIGGDEFKIIIDANSDYSGDSEVVVNAADDEGNSSSYNLPISITMPENNPPTISAPDSLSFDEGISHSFNVDVSDEDSIDELTFSGESNEYSAGFNKVDENTMEVVLTPKEAYKNFNGVSNLNLTVQDSQGATTQKDITLNVSDTPDVEFYNMPESASLKKGETKEITGYIRDDYTSLEELVMNASCENADVNIEKIGGDEFKIIIYANTDYSGDSEVVVNAADDEGNSNSYNLPISITMPENNPPTISAPDSLSFDEGLSHSFDVDVSDEDSIDELTFSGESNEYSAGFNNVDENTMEVVLTPKDNYKNFNGVSNLNLTVQDSHGATTQKDITLNVVDTPDVEFYDMPESVSVEKGETKEITGYIRDDYTPLEDLVLNASCDNADVSIEKNGGEEFKIIIDANSDYLGDSEVVVNAADDEGNSNSYNLPITITMYENNPPTISAPDSLSFDEGISHSFNVDVFDEDGWEELRFSAGSNEYSTYLITVDEDTMNITLTPKDNCRNFNGVSNLNLTVQDSQGATTQKEITLNVNDTPDVEFYNMPDSVSLNSRESTEVTGYIRDDYTSLEDLVLNASCENADVNIEKIGGDEFKIIIDANSDYSGDSEIVINAADDEGNSNSYNLPITINPIETRTLDVHLDFDGVNVNDNNDDIIDSWEEVPDIGPVLVSAYKVPVISYDEYTVSTEFPELDSIYLEVDRNARECIMEEQEFSNSSDINFSLNYEDKTLEDFIIEIDVRDKDKSHHNYSFLVDPQQGSVNKDIKVGQNDKILNILLGYGVANHENSGEQPVRNPDEVRKEVGVEYSTGAWPEGSPEYIWLIVKEGDNLTDEAYQAIRDSCEYFFPGVPIEIKDSYEIPIPNNTFLIQKAENRASATMSFWNTDYEYGTNYVRIGGVYLHYDSTEAVNEEIGTVAETAAEPQNIPIPNSIFAGNEEITPCDEAVFEIKHNQEPEVGWVVIYQENLDAASFAANATISADGRTVYVLPKREEF